MTVEVTGSAHLRRVYAQLREAGDRGLRLELNKAIRLAAKPAQEAVRASARTTLPRRGGLAALVAASKLTTAIKTGSQSAGVTVKAAGRHDIRSGVALVGRSRRSPLAGGRGRCSLRQPLLPLRSTRHSSGSLTVSLEREELLVRLTYTPEGAEPLSWDFTVGSLYSHEAEAMERQTGLSTNEIGQGLARGSTQAVHAILWVLLRRSPGRRQLRYDEVVFRLDEVDLDLDDDEKRRVIDALDQQRAAGEQLTADQEAAYAAIAADLAALPKEQLTS
jgi:hypothetical protein